MGRLMLKQHAYGIGMDDEALAAIAKWLWFHSSR
jgi:hypothetical protein